VPTSAEEAVRDLIRVREEVKADRRVARQRIRSFLARYGKRYPGGSDRWSFRFEVWARALHFEEPCAGEAFENLMSAYFVRDAQLSELGRRIEESAGEEPFADAVARLRTLRGIDTLSAMTIACETCDFSRFPTAGSLHGLHRTRTIRALERREQEPGPYHQDRQPPHPARARGGGLGVPSRPCGARHAQDPARGPTAGRGRLLMGRAVPVPRDLSQDHRSQRSAHRGGCHRA
jgi:hypothetical protein